MNNKNIYLNLYDITEKKTRPKTGRKMLELGRNVLR